MPEPATDGAAGDPAGRFLPDFLPFADRDGNLLCVDTRPGPLHGRVTELDKVGAVDSGADEAGARWLSLSAMFTDLADSLYTGSMRNSPALFVITWR